MRVVVAGLGIQGKKRMKVSGADVVATVDPVEATASHRHIRDVPLESYDAALVCTPDSAKFELLEYLLANGKHVLVEKPLLFDDIPQHERLQTLAHHRRVACYTAYNHRFEPHIVSLREVIRSERLGRIYAARFFYGNGTARDVRNSVWRDRGTGVLSDLGSHLLDMALFLFGESIGPFTAWSFNAFENRAFDYVVFASAAIPVLQVEMTLLSWRNTFTADVFAERGSAHIHGLCKWGPSVLTVRNRVLPSGRPTEESTTLEQPDPTWELEYAHFKQQCQSGSTNLGNDLWISRVLNDLTRQMLDQQARSCA